MKYESYPLGSLCSRATSGGTPKSTEYYDGHIPWLNTFLSIIHKTERCISKLGLYNSSAKWIAKHDVIVAMYGAAAGKVESIRDDLLPNSCQVKLIYPLLSSNLLNHRLQQES